MKRAPVAVPAAAPLPPRAKLLRPKGQGCVSRESDGYHARGPAPERVFLGVHESRSEAERALDEHLRPTVGGWLETFLCARDALRYRNVKDERSTVASHVTPDPIAALRLEDVGVPDARAWLARLLQKRASAPAHVKHCPLTRLSPRRVSNILTLVRCAFQAAVDEGRIESNPFRELRVPKTARASVREDFAGVLDPDEQTLVLAAFGDVGSGAVMLRVALGLGLRKNELRSLDWQDVAVTAHAPALVVRRGRGGGPTKSGKARRLPLFGLAYEALLAWSLKNPTAVGPVFPASRGHGTRKLPVVRFRSALKRAHIDRRVCWHDLRHSCATSLLMGWWGRKWSVPEVQRLLGHSSPLTTERYLHARNDLIFQAAHDMRSRDAQETWPTAELSAVLGPGVAEEG